MSSGGDVDWDSDGTSADTILKELCLLRCSSCVSSTGNTSRAASQFGSANFSSFCPSEGTEIRAPSSAVERPLVLSVSPESSANRNGSTLRELSSDSSNKFKEKHIFFDELSDSRLFSNPWFKRLQNLVTRSNDSTESILPVRSPQIKCESFSRASQVESRGRLHSVGTDPPNLFSHWIARADNLRQSDRCEQCQQTSAPSDSEGSGSVDCLLRERCSSPDCACDKGYRKTKRVSTRSSGFRRIVKTRGRPRSVGSQVTETIHGLKLSGWDGQIIIKEDDYDLSLDPMRNTREDSNESVPSVFELSRVSTLSDQSSDSAITFLKKCSDSNLLTSLGLKQDEGLLRKKIDTSSKDIAENKNKGQMVETYGKLLHKIEKLKKMTSWKSKKRKNKLKYTLEGTGYPEEQLHECPVTGDCVERKDKEKDADMHCMSCGDAAKDCEEQNESRRNIAETKQDTDTDLKCTTCEVATQSIQSVKSESFMTTVESSLDGQINLKDDQEASVNNNIQTTSFQTNEAELTNNCPYKKVEVVKNLRRMRPESAASFGACSLFQDVNKSLSSLGDRETQDEILEHLRQINNLIERESCVSNSNHRLCKSERSLGFEVNKPTKDRRSPKVDKEKQETNKSRKDSRVYWAVTKVTVYPDSCRTYEVMRLSRRRPQNIPTSSETVFVLLPNK